jgi:hypothetical protein
MESASSAEANPKKYLRAPWFREQMHSHNPTKKRGYNENKFHEPGTSCSHYGLPLTVSHILLECPQYDKDRRTFHLQGTLRDIPRDDLIVSNTAFFPGTGVDKFI